MITFKLPIHFNKH